MALHEIGSRLHLAWGQVKLMMDSHVEAAGMLCCLGRDFFSLAVSLTYVECGHCSTQSGRVHGMMYNYCIMQTVYSI
jgi:hypothetical protein